MNDVSIEFFNVELAYEFIAKKLDLTVQDVKKESIYFESLQKVFDYLYMDNSNSETDYKYIIDSLAVITAVDMTRICVSTPAEYMAFQWNKLHPTPYGYVAYKV